MLEALLPEDFFHRKALPKTPAFQAGKVSLAYPAAMEPARRLPDFYVGAQAAVGGYRLLT